MIRSIVAMLHDIHETLFDDLTTNCDFTSKADYLQEVVVVLVEGADGDFFKEKVVRRNLFSIPICHPVFNYNI